MKKIAYIILVTAILIALGILIFRNPKPKKIVYIQNNEPIQNVEIKDGTQYITINAKGGYLPKISTAKAGIPTKIIIKTNGTFDCSASLVIRSLNYQKILPQTGDTEVGIGVPDKDKPLRGICSMGMYFFEVQFKD